MYTTYPFLIMTVGKDDLLTQNKIGSPDQQSASFTSSFQLAAISEMP
jgi:hypothetical protein